MVSALAYGYRVVWILSREHCVVFLGKSLAHSQPLSSPGPGCSNNNKTELSTEGGIVTIIM